MEDQSGRYLAYRTKLLYLLLKLYNIVSTETIKVSKFEDLKMKLLVDFPLCTPICSELIKVFSENQILFANNIICDRLSINKSKQFILMETPFPIQDDQIVYLMSMFCKLFNYQELSQKSPESLHKYLFDASLPCAYKFLSSFVYLLDEQKSFDIDNKITFIVSNILILFRRLSLIQEDIELLKERILKGSLDASNSYMGSLEQSSETYSNSNQIKRVFINLMELIESVYPLDQIWKIQIYQRGKRTHLVKLKESRKSDGNVQSLVELILQTNEIDKGQSIRNLVTFCIEEFKESSNKVVFRKHNIQNSFIYLN